MFSVRLGALAQQQLFLVIRQAHRSSRPHLKPAIAGQDLPSTCSDQDLDRRDYSTPELFQTDAYALSELGFWRGYWLGYCMTTSIPSESPRRRMTPQTCRPPICHHRTPPCGTSLSCWCAGTYGIPHPPSCASVSPRITCYYPVMRPSALSEHYGRQAPWAIRKPLKLRHCYRMLVHSTGRPHPRGLPVWVSSGMGMGSLHATLIPFPIPMPWLVLPAGRE